MTPDTTSPTSTSFPTSGRSDSLSGGTSSTSGRGDALSGGSASTGGRSDAVSSGHGTAGSTMTGTSGQPDVMARVVQGAHATIDRLADAAAPHVSRVQAGVQSAGETLHQRADEMRDLSEEWTEGLRGTVRDNPLTAVVVALAAGMLIARLTR